MNRETSLALELLRKCPYYVDDARQGAPVGNSIVGSVVSLNHGIPRQYAERGVREALVILDVEAADRAEEAQVSLKLSREEVQDLLDGLHWAYVSNRDVDAKRNVALSKRLEALLK